MKYFLIILIIFMQTSLFAKPCQWSFRLDLNERVPAKLSLPRRAQVSLEQMVDSVMKAAKEGKGIPAADGAIYQYEWRRDSALVVLSLLQIINRLDPELKQELNVFFDFRLTVAEKFLNDMWLYPARNGEPKYNLDFSPFLGEWGRPQNDGASLNLIMAIEMAKWMQSQGRIQEKNRWLYIAFRELDYVLKVYRNPSFDIWEEALGQHFYTLMLHRKSLIQSLESLDFLSQVKKEQIETAIRVLDNALEFFWSVDQNAILAHRNHSGVDFKTNGLDIATILGVLHGGIEGRSFDLMDSRVASTVIAIEKIAAEKFALEDADINGLAVGRYEGDIWTGHDRSHPGSGNAWFLANHAMAEFYFKFANRMVSQKNDLQLTSGLLELFSNSLPYNEHRTHLLNTPLGSTIKRDSELFVEIQKSLVAKGELFLRRTGVHMSDEGYMSEQFNPYQHRMIGPEQLNWSYASFITAVDALDALPSFNR